MVQNVDRRLRRSQLFENAARLHSAFFVSVLAVLCCREAVFGRIASAPLYSLKFFSIVEWRFLNSSRVVLLVEVHEKVREVRSVKHRPLVCGLYKLGFYDL